MKYEQIILAHNSLMSIANMEMNLKDACAVNQLIETVNKEYYYFASLEQDLLDKYEGEVQPNGAISFVHGEDEESIHKGEENVQKFVVELNDLRNKEVAGEIIPVKLSCDTFSDLKITPNDLSALDGLVIFE